MPEPEFLSERSWLKKFHDAFRGMKAGIRGQSSFFIHFFMAAAVIAAALMLQVALFDWCILIVCITIVLTAEMFNSALEAMAKAISKEYDPHIGLSLNIGSAAVLVASMGAALVGLIVFINRLGNIFSWW